MDFDLEQCRGKKVLVVNTASGCALTPQYEELENGVKDSLDHYRISSE